MYSAIYYSTLFFNNLWHKWMFTSDKDLRFPVEMELQSNTGLRPYSSFDETLSNGGSKSRREEK